MRHLVAVVALVAMANSNAVATAHGQSPATAGSDTVNVQVDRTEIGVSLGGRFSFSSTLRNTGPRPMTGLIAHLNILSTDPGTYVDPEDWSTHRTQYLDPLPPHGSVTLTWPMQAVNTGGFVIYVAVISNPRVTVSGPIQLAVERQQTIDAGGVLPLAIAVPGAVAAAYGVLLLRRRRE